jgi:hypothetical protein
MDAFEVLQMLGRGSFGVAHKVRRVMDGLHCVVKRVNTADSDVHTKKLAAHEVRAQRARQRTAFRAPRTVPRGTSQC